MRRAPAATPELRGAGFAPRAHEKPRVARRALEIATRHYELNAVARRALERSRREEREGKVRRFTAASDAIAHLKRL